MAPDYQSITTHDDLCAWAAAYARQVRRERGVDVRLDTVEWDVSTRAKRRAGALKYPSLPDATVGRAVDWEAVATADGGAADGRPLPATVSLTWAAFEAFDREQWEALVRHELVHLEQYQYAGTTDHGAAFESRADDLDAPIHCPQFTAPAYVVRCRDCDGVVARRYRDCKLVREPGGYRSSCCGGELAVAEQDAQ